jgi:hypothetical protein
MLALAVLLVGAMVPGNNPERDSGEIRLTAPLDLRGKWQGIWRDHPKGETSPIGYRDGAIYMPGGHFPCEIVDDGEGRLHFTQRWEGYIGIYQQDGSRVIICYCDRRYGRPTSFRIGDGRHQLLILHRVGTDK